MDSNKGTSKLSMTVISIDVKNIDCSNSLHRWAYKG